MISIRKKNEIDIQHNKFTIRLSYYLLINNILKVND